MTGGEAWQRNQSSLACQKDEHYFYLADLNYPSELEVKCVPNILFGGHFPYWEIPGLDYPDTTQLACLNARICRDFPELSSKMDRRGFMDNFDDINSVVGDTFQYFCNMEGTRVHQKFSTSLDQPRNLTTFHFRNNQSQLEAVLMTRVFSKESFSLTFSTTAAQDNETLAFTFQEDKTTLTGSQDRIWDEMSIFEFGKLNEIQIDFSNNSIVIRNTKKGSGSIAITGTFLQYKFIGFYSEKLSSWIVPQSKIFK